MQLRQCAAALCAAWILPDPAWPETPENFTVAFIGDQGRGGVARDVLELIAAEGADAVVHSGDFDYADDPAAWDALITSVLGAEFPYFASAGNHDESVFYGAGGYQSFLEARMERLGLSWEGDLGVRSSHSYGGIHFVLTAPGVFGAGDGFHDAYIADRFAASEAAWRVSSWHKNQHLMQAGGKRNETGWGVYEASRRAGAIIATGHEHSYSRTHLLAEVATQSVASTGGSLALSADDPTTPQDEGRSFVFVSGLAGRGIRDQEVAGPWFASIYTSTQGADYGALFGVFHHGGDPRQASFYFKNRSGVVIDAFTVRTELCGDPDSDLACFDADNCSGTPNASQGDADRDGYGNACDADYDGTGLVTVADLGRLRTALGASAGEPAFDPALDHDESGTISISDWDVAAAGFGEPPGPSGLLCAGSSPCMDCRGAGDRDGDGVCDDRDNCLEWPNPSQADVDGDGFGTACDPDYDGSGVVTVSDFVLLREAFGSARGGERWLPAADHDGSHSITMGDVTLFSEWFGGAPGPSGLACAGSPPCYAP